jgi:ABC-type protease/lipase transport system fused ATPase/permease subunit
MAAAPGVRKSELGEALRACRAAFIGVGLMSCMINLLYLTGSIFMLEVYDRVLPSRSVPTLIGLVVLAGGLYVAQGGLDLIRGRILGRIGTSLDEAINTRVFETIVRLPLIAGNRNEGLQPLRDLDNVRSFLGSMGPGAFFDLPWLPLYLAICFAFHWLLGLTALVGAIILVILTLVTEFMSRQPARDAMTLAARRNDLAMTSRRNAEVLIAMGMSGRLTKRCNRRCSGSAPIWSFIRRPPPASSSQARSSPPGRWRRSISRSPTGKASLPRARAGNASAVCSSRCRRRASRPCWRIRRSGCRSRASASCRRAISG